MSVLAGPNNSGKTSLILLIKRVLMNTNFELKPNDYNIYDQSQWLKNFVEVLSNRDDSLLNDTILFKSVIEEDTKGLLLPEIDIRVQVNYEDDDDLTNFAQYLLDLDEKRHSFYFQYKIALKLDDFLASIQEEKIVIKKALVDMAKAQQISDFNSKTLTKLLLRLYCQNCTSQIYYCNNNYNVKVEIVNQKRFHDLFNLKYIPAARLMDDVDDKSHILSSGLISFAKNDDNWNKLINDVSQSVYGSINNDIVQVKNQSTDTLTEILKMISDANGGNLGDISLDVNVAEHDVQQLLGSTTRAQYTVQGTGKSEDLKYILNETSQGLGYSNLVYLDTQIETFIREFRSNKNNQKINMIIIEEPESHMHPQMQYVFAKQLINQYNNQKLQGIITTHSTEIVRGVDFKSLRILREKTLFNSKLCNLDRVLLEEKFMDSDGNMDNQIKSIFKLAGIADLVFADRAILFEGDTERLYLRNLIDVNSEFEKIRNKYVAYVQVGGAYAFKFEGILRALGIKSLIITDADYMKNTVCKEELTGKGGVKQKETTNATLKYFYKQLTKKSSMNLLMNSIYEWFDPIDGKRPDVGGKVIYKEQGTKLNGDKYSEPLILLTCQSKADKYTRTLEAAMLSKKFGLEPFQTLTKEMLSNMREDASLEFSIPDKEEFTLIDILNSMSNSKTDFMYSVIINNQTRELLPNYIEEGLKWLQK